MFLSNSHGFVAGVFSNNAGFREAVLTNASELMCPRPSVLQDPSFKLGQVDSSVGSVHASPHGIQASPVSTNHDDLHTHMQSPLSCQVPLECGDEMGGMCPPRSPHGVPGQGDDMNNASMAAAHSALIEMQNQGLTYQNIEELVQNIQNLLNCLRV
jgi:hypothetical protein